MCSRGVVKVVFLEGVGPGVMFCHLLCGRAVGARSPDPFAAHLYSLPWMFLGVGFLRLAVQSFHAVSWSGVKEGAVGCRRGGRHLYSLCRICSVVVNLFLPVARGAWGALVWESLWEFGGTNNDRGVGCRRAQSGRGG